MALKITDECINCDVCEPGVPERRDYVGAEDTRKTTRRLCSSMRFRPFRGIAMYPVCPVTYHLDLDPTLKTNTGRQHFRCRPNRSISNFWPTTPAATAVDAVSVPVCFRANSCGRSRGCAYGQIAARLIVSYLLLIAAYR